MWGNLKTGGLYAHLLCEFLTRGHPCMGVGLSAFIRFLYNN